MRVMQSLLRAVYPPHCLICSETVENDGGLCPTCWRDTPFIRGLVCDACGLPLPGEDPGEPVHCDSCLTFARPWSRGRAALLYHEAGRRMVLAFKYGDRTDLAEPAARWMHQVALPILEPDHLVVPVPLHPWRLLRRRYNQAALLAGAFASRAGLETCPDVLLRSRSTPPQAGKGFDERFRNMHGALQVNPRQAHRLPGRHVLMIDDVLTSGATLGAAAEACRAAGAIDVRILTLARASHAD